MKKIFILLVLSLLVSCSNNITKTNIIDDIIIDTNTGIIEEENNALNKVNTGETIKEIEMTKEIKTIKEINLINNDEQMVKKQNTILEDGDVVAVMKTTNGTIQILLETELAPKTTGNFIGLAKKGYYDGIIFHRIIKGFMIQGGDPTGTGMGGESIYGEKFDDEFHSDLKNSKYTISMANAGANTNGSQFFINVADNNFLDNKHSVFGEVVEGIENVDKLAKVKTNSGDKPEKEVKIISLEIKQYNNGVLGDYTFDLDSILKESDEKQKKEAEAKKTKIIESGDNISVHYTGTLENGEKFDSSYDRGDALEFTVGAGQMIKGFDAAVVGMKLGENKSIKLAPSDAYGERSDENKQVIPKADLASFEEAGFKLKVGTVLPTQMGQFTVIEVTDDTVTIDTNHAMAGKTLNFDIEIITIK